MNEYEAIRARLISKRDELQGRIAAIQRDVRREDRTPERDAEEQAVERENAEVLDALDAAARVELDQIARALQRIDARDYGKCVACGTAIPRARLEALPYTDRCVACAERPPAFE